VWEMILRSGSRCRVSSAEYALYTERAAENVKGKREFQRPPRSSWPRAVYPNHGLLIVGRITIHKWQGRCHRDLFEANGQNAIFVATDWGTVGSPRPESLRAGRLADVSHLAAGADLLIEVFWLRTQCRHIFHPSDRISRPRTFVASARMPK